MKDLSKSKHRYRRVLREEIGENDPRSLRLIEGNPLIMKQMVKVAPAAGSYPPVIILIDERSDGVRLSYDRMAGFLAPYENAKLSEWRGLWIPRSRPFYRPLRVKSIPDRDDSL